MKKVKLADKVEGVIPQSWAELSLKQWNGIIHMEKNEDYLEALSVLTTIDYKLLFCASVEDVEEKLLPHFDWFYKTTPPQLDLSVKKPYLEFNNIKHAIPEDIGFKSYGQKNCLQNEMNKIYAKYKQEDGSIAISDMQLISAYAIAVYMQPIVYGEAFDEDKCQAFSKLVDELPAVDMLPLADFFLKKFTASLKLKLKISEENTDTKNLQQAY